MHKLAVVMVKRPQCREHLAQVAEPEVVFVADV
jgi:hypothetical protein